jgi:menaquinone-dependent protoporphyrinogen oxidase
MNILVLYGTSEGQRRKIGAFVADRLRQQGQQVALRNIVDQAASINLAGFDGVILAARIHAGMYQRRVIRFATRNNRALAAMPTAFLSVSMAAANLRPGDMQAAERYVENFVRKTGWAPNRVLQVAGARLYTRHNAIGRWILGLVDRHLLDTDRDYEWTDWSQLERFASEFATDVLETHRQKTIGCRTAGSRGPYRASFELNQRRQAAIC